MWRSSKFTENGDSDQSISEDDEDDNGDLGQNRVSFALNAGKEEAFELQTRLDMLRASSQLNYARETDDVAVEVCAMGSNSSLEEDVEVLDCPSEGFACSRRLVVSCISDEELFSDDEVQYGTKLAHKDDHHSLRIAQDGGVAKWSSITKETKALVCPTDNASCLSFHSANQKENRNCKGVKEKMKPKFSFHFKLHKEMSSKINEIPKNLESVDQAIEDDLIAECHEDFDSENRENSAIADIKLKTTHHGCNKQSMIELLDHLKDDNCVVKGDTKTYCRRRGRNSQLPCKRSISLLGGTPDGGLPEPTDSVSSSDDESACRDLVLPMLEQKKQFVADRFHEALKATSLGNGAFNVPPTKPSGNPGLFRKLQQVVQKEKEQETDFLTKLQTGAVRIDDSNFIDVKILSRYLEARLTVCRCSIIKNLEDCPLVDSPKALANKGRERTIIFNPKVCGSVDLELGSSVRIYAPWKEVQVMATDEKIILCTYFLDMVT